MRPAPHVADARPRALHPAEGWTPACEASGRRAEQPLGPGGSLALGAKLISEQHQEALYGHPSSPRCAIACADFMESP